MLNNGQKLLATFSSKLYLPPTFLRSHTMTMKQALTSAGLEASAETEKTKKTTQVKYKVLHIPTASYIHGFDSKTNLFKLAVFNNKAKAGHARDDYRLQRFKSRSYSGYGLFLDEDFKNASKDRNGRISSIWQIQTQIREKMRVHGNFHKEEFELVPVEESDVNTMSVDS
jgi:hypothetical protein